MTPLVSESFANDASNAAGRFYSDQRTVENGTAQAGTLTIRYDAAAKSYTISTAGRTETFAPADLVASGSSDFTAFQKTVGSLSESLSLTNPATSGALTYKYVGGGAWERADVGSGTMDFTYDPFTYGVVTPDAALARSGTGIYAVSLVGARAMGSPYAMAGSGGLQIDFAAGQIESSGSLSTIDVSTGAIKGIGVFFGSAALSSTTNSFSGSFAMDDGSRFTGGWQGRFYGPNADEVGATWQISAADGEVAAGYLVGRQDASINPYNFTLTNLQFSEDFAGRFSELSYTDLGGGLADSDGALYRSNLQLSYDAAANSFEYSDPTKNIDTTFTPGDLNSSASNSAVTVYDMTDGTTPYRLTLSKPGAGNPDIALTYTSFGHWQRAQSAAGPALDRWFVWGGRTNGFQIPTGTGHFDGILRGTAVTMNGGATYTLTGTSSFDVNFDAATFSGSLNPMGTSNSDNSTRNFGTFTFDRGMVDLDANMTADVINSGGYLGYFEGGLFGPKATEVGGSFGFQTETTNGSSTPSANAAYLNGAVVAKRTGP